MDKLSPTTPYEGQDTRDRGTPTNIPVGYTDDQTLNTYPSAIADWYEDKEVIISDRDTMEALLAQGWIVTFTQDGTEVINGVEVSSPQWKMARRVLNPEKAMTTVITDFVKAYNEGRKLNDDRYDDIITLYAALIDKTEDAANDIEDDDETYSDLIDNLLDGMVVNYTAHATDADARFEDYGDAQRTRIATQFDNKLAALKAARIAKGLNNSTIAASEIAGVERERAIALNDLEDKILVRQDASEDRLYVLRDDLSKNLVSARQRVRDQIQSQDLARLGLRNNLAEALYRFMERRTDSYPNIGDVNRLAIELGASQPATYPAP